MEPPWVSVSRSSDTMSPGLEDATHIPLPTVNYRIKMNTLQFNQIACYKERPLSCL